jgi:bifunctional ADP-heptose synthase (sugar kinase/adenylyltransferase)
MERLREILHAARGLKVGVVGDFTLDGYWFADMTRAAISRETPLFPRPVVRERYTCGGAANVAWNLAALGVANVRAFTVIGQDWRGAVLRQVLREAGVDTRDVLETTGWATPFFGKVIGSRRTRAWTLSTPPGWPWQPSRSCWLAWKPVCPSWTRLWWQITRPTA